VSKVFKGRYSAAIEGDFVVFLIGMRLNQPWKVWEWWPVAMAMPRMLKELYARPELGFLGTEYFLSFGNRAPVLVQYWRSFEQLDAYARAKDQEHLPAWREFNRKAGRTASVGVWHETYLVGAGRSEAVYANMPRFGLAMAGDHVPATGQRETARQRLTG
jgi:hypothetical protein